MDWITWKQVTVRARARTHAFFLSYIGRASRADNERRAEAGGTSWDRFAARVASRHHFPPTVILDDSNPRIHRRVVATFLTSLPFIARRAINAMTES